MPKTVEASYHRPPLGKPYSWSAYDTYNGWKLIVYPKVPVVRLYHLATDPQELIDLAGQPQYADRIGDLLTRLRTLQAEFDDPLDLSTIVPALVSGAASGPAPRKDK